MGSDLKSDFGKGVKKIGRTDSVLDFNIDLKLAVMDVFENLFDIRLTNT